MLTWNGFQKATLAYEFLFMVRFATQIKDLHGRLTFVRQFAPPAVTALYDELSHCTWLQAEEETNSILHPDSLSLAYPLHL